MDKNVDPNEQRKEQAVHPGPTGYAVGYRKPPRNTRFKKGQSGNPKGRPKGSRNMPPEATRTLRQLLVHEAYRDVTIQDRDGPVSMSVAQAAIRSMGIKAAKGSVTAQKLFLSSLSAVEQEKAREQEELFAAVSDYKRQKLSYIEDCKRAGREPGELLPHPDDIELDMRSGRVIFHGPIDETDKTVWDELWARKGELEYELVYLYEQFEIKQASEDPDAPEVLVNDIVSLFWQLDMTDQAIMMRWHLPAERMAGDFLRRRVLQDRVDNHIWPRQPRLWQATEISWDQRLHLKHLAERRKSALTDASEPDDGNGAAEKSD